jgi:hypothetical protein
MARPEVTGRKEAAAGATKVVTGSMPTGPPADVDAYSLSEFARRHGVSLKTLYKHPELMPDCFFVGTRRLVSRESAARWRRQRELAAAECNP